ncbi:uncharacterized protein ISCGN_010359 [Ixodes scapularis]
MAVAFDSSHVLAGLQSRAAEDARVLPLHRRHPPHNCRRVSERHLAASGSTTVLGWNMAYINIAEWTPEHVADWLRGLDDIIIPYVHFFLNNDIDGHHLLTLGPDDLTSLNIAKIGHQELILEAVDHLRQLHYRLITENLQSLALKLGCRARSLYNDMMRITPPNQDNVPKIATSILADVSEVLMAVKSFVSWLDRAPFEGQERYFNIRKTVLKLGIELASTAQRDHFADKPFAVIQNSCKNLADLCDMIIQECNDSLIIQPASLDVATVKKKPEEEWGMQINSSYSGIHIVGGVKFQSPSHRCGKVDVGDEIVQINYQTVVGWQLKHLVYMLQEHPTEVLLTLKKRPRHTNILGQVIVLRPYRIPLKKVTYGKVHMWPENGVPAVNIEEVFPNKIQQEPSSPRVLREVEDDDSAFLPDETAAAHAAAAAVAASASVVPSIRAQVFPPRSRAAIHRRATVSGASPTVTKAPVSIQDLVAGGIPFFGGSKKKDAVSRSVSHDPGCHTSGGKLAVVDGGAADEGGTQAAEAQRRVEVVTPKARTASDSAVVPLVGRAHLRGGEALSPPLADCRGPAAAEQAKPANCAVPSAQPKVQVHEAHPDAGSRSPRERRLFGPAAGKLSPMVALKVPKIEDLKKYHIHDRSSKTKSQETPNAPGSSLCGSEVPSKLGFSSRDSSKKSLCQSQALHTKSNCSDKLGERRVPCPELGVAECEGWLLRRKAQKTPVVRLQQPQQQPQPAWHRRWALLRGTGLFLYRTPQDQKAECLLFVPGFVVSLAPDCKSNNCAFKLCNSGATFYFASESQVDTLRWLTKLSQAVMAARGILSRQGPYLSETDEEDDLEAFLDKKDCPGVPTMQPTSNSGFARGPPSSDNHRQSPKPMPRTIFLRSTHADKSATLSPRRMTGEPPPIAIASNASLPRNHTVSPPLNQPLSHESSPLPPSVIYQNPPYRGTDTSSAGQTDPRPDSKQRLSGVWDGDALGNRPPPARREPPNPRCKPPTGHYVNVGFKHGEKDATRNDGRLADGGGRPAAPSRPVQRRPSASKLSRSKTADSVAEATPKKETLLDREYNRVFKKSPSSSSSPDPTQSSDGSAPSPIPTNAAPQPQATAQASLLPRCATSQEIKDLYTNRRNSWRGSQQELVPLSTDLGDSSPCLRDASALDYARAGVPAAHPDVIPSQYRRDGGTGAAEERCPDPWVPRDKGPPRSSSCCQGFDRTRGPSGEKLSSPFVRAGSCVPAMHCRAEQPSPPPKSPSRFFHSPKFLKKFASSTREGISNMLRSPRLERRKMSSERDMYGSPKLSRSAGVRLLKSAAAAASSASVEAVDETSPLANKSGSSSSLNSSASAGSFVTSSSSSHCYAEVFVAPGARPDTPDTPPPRTPSRPTMGVSMLRGGKRRTSSSVAGSEERSFSPCSVASSSASVPWARDDGSVFGDDAPPTGDVFHFGTATVAGASDGGSEHALGSGSERD